MKVVVSKQICNTGQYAKILTNLTSRNSYSIQFIYNLSASAKVIALLAGDSDTAVKLL